MGPRRVRAGRKVKRVVHMVIERVSGVLPIGLCEFVDCPKEPF